jgi:hypothetical protein
MRMPSPIVQGGHTSAMLHTSSQSFLFRLELLLHMV